LAVAGIVIVSIGIPAAGASVPPSDAAAASTYDYDAPAAPTIAPGNTRIPSFRSYDATSKLSASGTHANSSRLAAKAPSRLWRPNEVLGRRVYQRDDLIDPRRAGPDGRTNLQRMREGDAPMGPDDQPINLHHTIQKEPGPVAEVAQSFHRANRRALHVNWSPRGFGSVHPSKSFEAWRSNYWRQRAGDFGP